MPLCPAVTAAAAPKGQPTITRSGRPAGQTLVEEVPDAVRDAAARVLRVEPVPDGAAVEAWRRA